MFCRCVLISIVFGLLLSNSPSVLAAEAVSYNVIDLGILGCPQTIANALNVNGDVVGYYYPSPPNYSQRAFIYSNGATNDLGTLFEGARMNSLGINASGQVVGWAFAQGAGYHAFLKSNGAMLDLGKLPGDTSNIFDVKAHAINDRGQVVGSSNINSSYHAFLYSNGSMIDLGTPAGCSSSIASAINDSGQVVGYGSTSTGVYHAFLYSNGQMKILDTLGGLASVATSINASGQVVGVASTGSGSHVFLYTDGKMSDLGGLPGAATNRAESINSSGQIVGFSFFTGSGSRAFLYSKGTMRSLNELIDPALHWNIFSANAINDNGWIAASGSANGEQHALLLTPVPEPSTIALLSFGSVGLLACAWRRRNRKA